MVHAGDIRVLHMARTAVRYVLQSRARLSWNIPHNVLILGTPHRMQIQTKRRNAARYAAVG